MLLRTLPIVAAVMGLVWTQPGKPPPAAGAELVRFLAPGFQAREMPIRLKESA